MNTSWIGGPAKNPEEAILRSRYLSAKRRILSKNLGNEENPIYFREGIVNVCSLRDALVRLQDLHLRSVGQEPILEIDPDFKMTPAIARKYYRVFLTALLSDIQMIPEDLLNLHFSSISYIATQLGSAEGLSPLILSGIVNIPESTAESDVLENFLSEFEALDGIEKKPAGHEIISIFNRNSDQLINIKPEDLKELLNSKISIRKDLMEKLNERNIQSMSGWEAVRCKSENKYTTASTVAHIAGYSVGIVFTVAGGPLVGAIAGVGVGIAAFRMAYSALDASCSIQRKMEEYFDFDGHSGDSKGEKNNDGGDANSDENKTTGNKADESTESTSDEAEDAIDDLDPPDVENDSTDGCMVNPLDVFDRHPYSNFNDRKILTFIPVGNGVAKIQKSISPRIEINIDRIALKNSDVFSSLIQDLSEVGYLNRMARNVSYNSFVSAKIDLDEVLSYKESPTIKKMLGPAKLPLLAVDLGPKYIFIEDYPVIDELPGGEELVDKENSNIALKEGLLPFKNDEKILNPLSSDKKTSD